MIISAGHASDSGSEGLDGSGGGSCSLGSSCNESSFLLLSMIEPDLDVSLPVLSEVVVGDYVVMLNHHKINLFIYFQFINF